MTAKGNFSRCSICINVQILRGKRNWSASERGLLDEYQKKHNEKQLLERRVLQENRDTSRLHPDDLCCILFDAMDSAKGELPCAPARMTPKGAQGMQRWKNRIWGVEIVNGTIDGTHLYLTDEFVPSGSDMAVEVIRRALGFLASARQQSGLPPFPRKLCLTADNCAENKNRTVFGYLSALVSCGFFCEIEYNFLMPGTKSWTGYNVLHPVKCNIFRVPQDIRTTQWTDFLHVSGLRCESALFARPAN
jgi:hypothetical protein